MPSPSPLTPHARPERERARARLAGLVRHRPPDDPDIDRARRDLAAARVQGLLQAALAELALVTGTPGAGDGDAVKGADHGAR